MGNTYTRLWAIVPEEKRYFVDPPFINEFYTLISDFLIGFATDFPVEACLKFHRPLQWITLVYEEDLLQYKYSIETDSIKTEHGYESCTDAAVAPPPGGSGTNHIVSQERFIDGLPHLQFQIDDQDRRQFTVWNMHQLACVLAMTKRTWDMEIASILYFQPDPVKHIFADKYDVGDVQQQRMLDAVSKVLLDMETNGLEERPYQRLYMLLQQFDLFYLYRRMFMNFDDKTYIDPNLPHREIDMLDEMGQYGHDAPLKGAYFNGELSEWGWSAPLFRQIYGDVAYVTVVTNDDIDHCLTINVTGIYENGLLDDKDDYRLPADSMISTIVMWLRENDKDFAEHFVRASYRYATRQEIERERFNTGQVKTVSTVTRPKKFVTMDKYQKLVFRDHLDSPPIIHRKAGYWSYLRQVHKNEHSANKMLYFTMAHKEDPRPCQKILRVNEQAREDNRIVSLIRHEVGGDPMTLTALQNASIARMKPQEPDYFPEEFPYDPKDKLNDGLIPADSYDAAKTIPEYWILFRIHRLLRWGCPASIVAGALMIDGGEFYKESNAPIFKQFPVVEVALNMCELISTKEYGVQKFAVLELLTRLCQCKFTLRQMNFYNGVKAISKALKSRFVEVRMAAAVCLTQLQELIPENRQIVGRDGALPLLLEVMRNPEETEENYWFHNYIEKHHRKWPEEILLVAAAQAANAVWLAVEERRNRLDFVRIKGITTCIDLLRGGLSPDYATIPVIGILTEVARESEFHHEICSSGALAVVCKVLHHTNTEDVFQNACQLIALICDCDEAREIIRTSKGLEPLLKPLRSPNFWTNPGCMQMATEALYKTAIAPLSCEFYRSKGAIDLALDRIYEGAGETIVFNVLGFIGEMVRLEGCRQTIRGNGSLPFIMDYMLHDNQFIRMKAAVTTGRMGADKESFIAIMENNGIIKIWNLMNNIYDPLVGVHACQAIYPLFVANAKETARVIRTIVNPFGPLFGLFDMHDSRLTDAVMNLICLLAHDDDLLAIMTDVGFCPAVAQHVKTKDVRLLKFVMEAIARGSEYAVNRVNFSTCEGVLPTIAKLLSHKDDEVQNHALCALHELTKYPQNIIQVHSEQLVRHLLKYLMEGSAEKAKKAAGCLRHMRYLAMANMGDVYNFEDVYFPIRSEERKAIERTKQELLTKKLVPEAKAEADKMKEQVQKAKRAKMQLMGIPPIPPAPLFLNEDRRRLPQVLLRAPYDPVADSDVPPPEQPKTDLREVPTPALTPFREPTHLRQDRADFDRALQNGTVKDENLQLPVQKEWWNNPFDEENYNLFNRLTIKNNYLADNVDQKTIQTKPQTYS
ncbi:putative Armadillo repeat-containing protein 4 [Hypsibius exemplaris]|uniref:Armadillo repeat-containing protein 4 n=1 Tax=Hypsibius exemplaris TaxID=2072580 RepID=A0A1W0W8X2_HYPEX|nr:putative Armadillo repeat-containing protein 4 [Hypsibius exemplaris]